MTLTFFTIPAELPSSHRVTCRTDVHGRTGSTSGYERLFHNLSSYFTIPTSYGNEMEKIAHGRLKLLRHDFSREQFVSRNYKLTAHNN